MNTRVSTALSIVAALAMSDSVRCENRYLQHNLVSDLPGLADHVDANLVNPWAISASPTSPFWIVNNGPGLANVYDSSGNTVSLVVTVPAASGSTDSSPTGQVFNGTPAFVLEGGKAAVFLFCTEDGTISGWYNGIDNNTARIAVNNSGSGAVYKGLAIGTSDFGPVLYAANFHAGTVDVFGSDFAPKTLAGTFTDPGIPAGFAPFNVYVAAGKVYVGYAKQDAEQHDDSPGTGNGYIDVFDSNGKFLQRLISGGRLNSPWGMVIAPDDFGDFSKALLVGNFGDGTINAYNASTGEFLGTLQDAAGKPIVNSGLWALQFGNGKSGGDATALYFTAGISGPAGDAIESHGLFGSIQAAPIVRAANGIVNAASFQSLIAPNTWVSIFGKNLAATTRTWQAADFIDNHLPTVVDGVSVTVDGKPAYVAYVSPTQVNILTPGSLTFGNVSVQMKNGGLIGDSATVQAQTVSPALFTTDKYAIATHADNALVTPSRPAQPGETIVLFGTGFGPTNPPVPEGTVVTSAVPLLATPLVLIGGATADVVFAGLTATGVYQFNVKVPSGLASGDVPLVIRGGGAATADGILVPIDNPMPATPADFKATIDNFQFAPNPIEAATGGKLTWTNKQAVEHTVVSDTGQFRSQVLGENETFSITLAAPGTYTYHCSIHPFMKGQVVVK